MIFIFVDTYWAYLLDKQETFIYKTDPWNPTKTLPTYPANKDLYNLLTWSFQDDMLTCGGIDHTTSPYTYQTDCYIYSLKTETWTPTGSMLYGIEVPGMTTIGGIPWQMGKMSFLLLQMYVVLISECLTIYCTIYKDTTCYNFEAVSDSLFF